MAPPSKGKQQGDHITAFNVLVTDYRVRRTDKILTEIDKIIAVLARISDPSVFQPRQPAALSLLLNCHHLLSSLEPRASTSWALVGLLANLAASCDLLASFLANKLALMPVLARLLHCGPSQARTCRLLELVQLLAPHLRLSRREAFLSSLLEDLTCLITTAAAATAATSPPSPLPLSSLALRCLCHLTADSYIAAKTLLVFLPLDKCTTTNFSSVTDQIAAEFLCICLQRVQLSSTPPSEDKVKSLLRKSTEAFCSALVASGTANNSLPTLKLINAFVSKLRSLPEYRNILATQDITAQLQRLLTVQDFSADFDPASADVFFRFLCQLVASCSLEAVSLFDHVVKLMLVRLEAKPASGKVTDRAASALDLVKVMIEVTDLHSLSATEKGILKFQVEQLVPSLMLLTMYCRPTKDSTVTKETLNSVVHCLQLLQQLAAVGDWTAVVGQLAQVSKMSQAYGSILASLSELGDKAQLATEFISLAALLREEDPKWKRCYEELVAEREQLVLVALVLRSDGFAESLVAKSLAIVKTTNHSVVEEGGEREEVEQEQVEASMSPEAVLRIDQMLETVSTSLASTSLEPVLGEVVELAVARRSFERHEVDCLTAALAGADARVEAMTRAAAVKDAHARQLERQVVGLVTAVTAAREELSDIRRQHGDLSREADVTRDRLGRELAHTKADVEAMEADKAALAADLEKSKEEMAELKIALKQRAENESLLTAELKKEMKLKEEKEMNIKKRDEKLKKKEKLLEEASSAKEKAEKEVEELKKLCGQLQALSKSQEQALAKKEKQLQDNDAEMKDLRKIQETIFNLSKVRSGSGSSSGAL